MAKVTPGEFIRQVRSETAKVSWPTRRETITTAIMVLIMTTLLAIFFFVAGLELKREFLVGDLRSPARAAVPVFAAVSGVVFPALVFLATVGLLVWVGDWRPYVPAPVAGDLPAGLVAPLLGVLGLAGLVVLALRAQQLQHHVLVDLHVEHLRLSGSVVRVCPRRHPAC